MEYVCASTLQRWSIRLLVGFTDPYNHTDSESLWWKLFKNHKRSHKDRDKDSDKDKDTEKVPATPDIVTPCFPLGDHLATTLMCSPYPISSSDTHQHPIGHLWNICESQSHRHHHILIISWLSSKCSKGKPIIFSSWKRSLGKAWRFYRPFHWRPLALIRVLGLPEEQVQSRAILFCVIVFFIINKVWVGAPLRGSLHLTS